ncbi:MAG: DIP1984 family protein [Deltaproteobacteria bacterium]|nr:DIP1984 family protein [Deltaproteobacteria bacterium]
MKLAEALMERKARKTRMEELKQRIYRHAQVQEGEIAPEDPQELLEALSHEVEAFLALVAQINHTNTRSRLPQGQTLTQALIRRDMLRYLHLVHTNLGDKACAPPNRYSKREIKTLPSVDVALLRKKTDALARDHRLLDLAIQGANWAVELDEL